MARDPIFSKAHDSDHQDLDVHRPSLTETEREIVEDRTALRPAVVHEAIREEGETELARSNSALAWSGLAAGLSMGFSFISQGLIAGYLTNASWRPLLTNAGYSVGFLAVVLGRQQLFTENTLTVVLPLLVARDRSTLANVGRVWAIVLAANLVGTSIIGWAVGHTEVLTPGGREVLTQIGRGAVAGSWTTVFIRAIFAGWLIAMMVWMLPATEGSRAFIIVVMTYIVGLGEFPHVIAGSVDAFYLVISGLAPPSILLSYLAPTLLGNIVGGVSLVALVNHAQVITEY